MPRSALALTIGFAAETIRESAPHVHCVAPRAATSFVSDVLHAVGARSVVTGTSPDALAAAASAEAVAVDLGTLTSEWSDAVTPTLAQLRADGTPWVLDVTRLGRSPLHPDRVRSLVGYHPTVVRADERVMDGVNLDAGGGALALGESVAQVVADGREIAVPLGSPMLSHVPGVRSAVSALTAACAAVAGPGEAALAAAAWVALASERADRGDQGPASFRVALLDALWTVRGDEIAEYLNLD